MLGFDALERELLIQVSSVPVPFIQLYTYCSTVTLLVLLVVPTLLTSSFCRSLSASRYIGLYAGKKKISIQSSSVCFSPLEGGVVDHEDVSSVITLSGDGLCPLQIDD